MMNVLDSHGHGQETNAWHKDDDRSEGRACDANFPTDMEILPRVDVLLFMPLGLDRKTLIRPFRFRGGVLDFT